MCVCGGGGGPNDPGEYGDDGTVGHASQYDIRYAEGAFGPLNWETATRVTDVSVPKSAGELDTLVVSGLKYDFYDEETDTYWPTHGHVVLGWGAERKDSKAFWLDQ